MPEQISRRETFKRGLAATSLLALVPEWAMPALAQGETDIPFTDLPRNFNPSANPNAATRQYDIRKIDGMLTPKDQFFTTQHLNKPEIDPATYRLKFTGMVNKPAEFSLADLRAMKSTEMVLGFECSGNSARADRRFVFLRPLYGRPVELGSETAWRPSASSRGGLLRH